MIGLSLSFCVLDIVEGKVSINDVQKIITGSVFGNAGVDRLVDLYCDSWWHRCKREAATIFYELLEAGKIQQPRLIKDDHFPVVHEGIRWVATEAEIEWNDERKNQVA